jgi:hypothetical protein
VKPGFRKLRTVRRFLVTEAAVYVGTIEDYGELPAADERRFYDNFELLSQPAPK